METRTNYNLLTADSLTKLYKHLVSVYNTTDFSDIKTKSTDGETEIKFYQYISYCGKKEKKTLDTVIRYRTSLLTGTLVNYAQVWHEDALEELIYAIKCSGEVNSILTRSELVDTILADLN